MCCNLSKMSRFAKVLFSGRRVFYGSWKIANSRRLICSIFENQDHGEPTQTMEDVKNNLMALMGVSRGYEIVPPPRDHLLQLLPKSQTELPKRTMKDSFDTAVIPLSSNINLQDKYLSHHGSIRWGRLTEDMDIFAVWCVMRHLKYDKIPEKTPTPYVVATLLVDEINFVDYEPKPTADIRISGHVCWIGKTSAEVVVWLEQKTQGVWQRITRALFLMAGRNSINTGPAIMNPLEPTNEEERKIVMGGEERKKRRQTALSKSLFRTGPDEAEQGLIHELFLKTVDERDMLLNRRILPANCNWITDTKLNNVILCHPEDRNLHNKVFGGFLMRQALELSWNASYIYSKWKPRLLHISDIIFHRPVDVGSMLQMSAYVTYTEKNYVQILVYAEVLNQKTGKTSTTNFFNYTYEAREIVSPILPQSYHEAMMYLDGRRHFLHVMGLHRESLNNNL